MIPLDKARGRRESARAISVGNLSIKITSTHLLTTRGFSEFHNLSAPGELHLTGRTSNIPGTVGGVELFSF